MQGAAREGPEVARRTRWRPVDGLRRSGQWFNLGEMKGISAALCAPLQLQEIGRVQAGREAGDGRALCSLLFICQTTNPI